LDGRLPRKAYRPFQPELPHSLDGTGHHIHRWFTRWRKGRKRPGTGAGRRTQGGEGPSRGGGAPGEPKGSWEEPREGARGEPTEGREEPRGRREPKRGK